MEKQPLSNSQKTSLSGAVESARTGLKLVRFGLKLARACFELARIIEIKIQSFEVPIELTRILLRAGSSCKTQNSPFCPPERASLNLSRAGLNLS